MQEHDKEIKKLIESYAQLNFFLSFGNTAKAQRLLTEIFSYIGEIGGFRKELTHELNQKYINMIKDVKNGHIVENNRANLTIIHVTSTIPGASVKLEPREYNRLIHLSRKFVKADQYYIGTGVIMMPMFNYQYLSNMIECTYDCVKFYIKQHSDSILLVDSGMDTEMFMDFMFVLGKERDESISERTFIRTNKLPVPYKN